MFIRMLINIDILTMFIEQMCIELLVCTQVRQKLAINLISKLGNILESITLYGKKLKTKAQKQYREIQGR